MFDDFSAGKFTGALFGHGGSCREPQETLALYQSISEAIPGGHAVNFSRWKNPEFDKLADEAYRDRADRHREADRHLEARPWRSGCPSCPTSS